MSRVKVFGADRIDNVVGLSAAVSASLAMTAFMNKNFLGLNE